MRLGVNTRERSLRWRSWAGGSSKMRMPGGIWMPALISSRMPPRPESEGGPGAEPELDVLVAAERAEVVGLVVVDGRLLAGAAGTWGTGRRLMLDVVGVVAHRRRIWCHRWDTIIDGGTLESCPSPAPTTPSCRLPPGPCGAPPWSTRRGPTPTACGPGWRCGVGLDRCVGRLQRRGRDGDGHDLGRRRPRPRRCWSGQTLRARVRPVPGGDAARGGVGPHPALLAARGPVKGAFFVAGYALLREGLALVPPDPERIAEAAALQARRVHRVVHVQLDVRHAHDQGLQRRAHRPGGAGARRRRPAARAPGHAPAADPRRVPSRPTVASTSSATSATRTEAEDHEMVAARVAGRRGGRRRRRRSRRSTPSPGPCRGASAPGAAASASSVVGCPRSRRWGRQVPRGPHPGRPPAPTCPAPFGALAVFCVPPLQALTQPRGSGSGRWWR